MNNVLAAITGVHGYLPETKLTNAELEKMVDTTEDWILSRTGIAERRILKEKGKATSDMAVHAVNGLLKKTNTAAEEVELIICATVTGDMTFPATANIIADKTGLSNAFGYDLNAACSGFIYALHTASQFIQSKTYKKIIVVGADKMSSIINYKDRKTCIIFGDGAAAVMLEPEEDGTGIQDAYMKSDGSGRVFLHQKAGGSLHPPTKETVEAEEHYVFQDGQSVFKVAVTKMAEAGEIIMKRNNLKAEDIHWLVPHQANKRIIDATASRMGLDSSKVMLNIEKYGNTTNATIPLCLWEWENKLNKGDNIVLAAFGGGFTWGAMYIKWSYNS
ncbi:MAG: ketoacyl-ACP synthase III [Chitinophagaceae bacterium]|nr:MAG: ketoacyl-ACP synthase III [Chitinophagaceae bacterium]